MGGIVSQNKKTHSSFFRRFFVVITGASSRLARRGVVDTWFFSRTFARDRLSQYFWRRKEGRTMLSVSPKIYESISWLHC
jgi:hypothetical protein